MQDIVKKSKRSSQTQLSAEDKELDARLDGSDPEKLPDAIAPQYDTATQTVSEMQDQLESLSEIT